MTNSAERACTPPPRACRAVCTPGLRQAPQSARSQFSRDLQLRPLDLSRLAQHLQQDPLAAILPLGSMQPPLAFAMSRGCSVAVLMLLLDHGASPEQSDGYGRTALGAVLAMPAQDAPEPLQAEWAAAAHAPRFLRALLPGHMQLARRHVSYAITLLMAGARIPLHFTVGHGNEACAQCVLEYQNAVAAAVLRRWMRTRQDLDAFSAIAEFLHCRR